MAKRIIFETEVNPKGMDAGLNVVASKVAAANKRIQQTSFIQAVAAQQQAMAGWHGGASGGYGYGPTRIPTGPAANWPHQPLPATGPGMFKTGSGTHQFTKADRMGNMGAASSMFVSVARDSAASYASGAPVSQIAAQQAPQVLQALAMLSMMKGKIAELAAGALKASLSLGLVALALFGFHKITRAIADLIYDVHGLAGTGRGLKRVGEGLRQARAEQDAENKKKEEKAAAEKKLDDETYATNRELGTTKAMIREASAGDAEAARRMVVERLRAEERLAAMASAKSSQYEFIPGRQDLRKKALEDQLALAKATLERQNAENALKEMKPEVKPFTPGSDALTSVGNFLGGGSRGLIDSIAQKTLEEAKAQTSLLREHGKNLKEIAKNTGPNGGKPTLEVPGG